MASSFCREKGKHGGCALYIHNSCTFNERIDITTISVSNIFECSAIQFNLGSTRIIAVCIYRSPQADVNIFFEKITTILQKCLQEKAEILIMGDFNIDILSDNKETREFISIAEYFSLKFTIKEPTRLVSRSCLDNFITNIEGDTKVTENHISDHSTCVFRFAQDVNEGISKTKYFNRKINEETTAKFLNCLSEQNWQDIFEFETHEVNEMWNNFENKFKILFNECFPLVKRTIRSKSNKFIETPDLKKMKNVLDYLLIASTTRQDLKSSYNRMKKKYDRAISEAKRAHTGKIIATSDNKSRATWRLVNSLTGKKHKNNECPIKTNNPKQLAEEFNEFFANAAPSLVKNLPMKPPHKNKKQKTIKNSFFVFDITNAEVMSALKKLKNTNTCGYDEIPVSLLKNCISQIVSPLTHILNCIFKEGIFPDALKVAIVRPLFKKGKEDEFGNYRPISLLSSFSKIIEKVIATRLIKFFRKFNIISNCQHGYMRNKNAETAMYELTLAILDALEGGDITLGLFLDLSKAFDCVDHRKLLDKLEMSGIRDKQLNLMRSYLRNRIQRVVISKDGEKYSSEGIDVNVGIPQGSILGPLLFLIYANDIGLVLPENCELVNFADDTNILLRCNNLQISMDLFSSVMDEISSWCCENKLILNMQKTVCTYFCTNRCTQVFPNALSCKDGDVNVKEVVSFLGIAVDKNLKWKDHVEQLGKKLNSVIYTLNFLKRMVDDDVLRTIYFANFQSLSTYSILFWGSSSVMNRIFLKQKWAIRVITGKKYRESCRTLFKKNKILTIPGLYIYRLMLFFHKHNDYFFKYKNHNNTRRMFPWFFPDHTLTCFEKHPLYMAIKVFNVLPKKLQNIQVYNVFRKEIYKLIMNCEPYDIEEFFNFCS